MGSENFKGHFKTESKNIKLPVLGRVLSVFHHLVYNVDHLVGPPCKTLIGRFRSLPWTTRTLVSDSLRQNNCKHEYNKTSQLHHNTKTTPHSPKYFYVYGAFGKSLCT
jgi:hypothetical protein